MAMQYKEQRTGLMKTKHTPVHAEGTRQAEVPLTKCDQKKKVYLILEGTDLL